MSHAVPVSRCTRSRGSTARTADPSWAKNHRMLFSVNKLGKAGQVLLIAGMGWALSVGGEKLNYASFISLGFYYFSLSF